ncbi:hypothetical protein F7R01_08170 [Pseudomonas argentinensis]|uniref:Amino acid transporter n=1 Tax=Phytopseudomonas argentinensis TaxID=289370 RepID=A0A1I3JK37_9GAMM|nr:hypothetical protein [Pseudomonas argentinensis]KAB0551165.1 hypothetical protein F7R01_08170 [Pseudomonas argentinensis]SFI60639.1 hypothetical protein SAMN05216602_1892 [Pseudomonas argentinensis]
MEYLDWLQWPAMLITVIAAWLVASKQRRRRNLGFWVFMASNLLWIAWGLYSQAYALIVLQLCLGAMNIRGAIKTEPETERA